MLGAVSRAAAGQPWTGTTTRHNPGWHQEGRVVDVVRDGIAAPGAPGATGRAVGRIPPVVLGIERRIPGLRVVEGPLRKMQLPLTVHARR